MHFAMPISIAFRYPFKIIIQISKKNIKNVGRNLGKNLGKNNLNRK
jgi:hypothetical protein